MRSRWVAVCLAALSCGACASSVAQRVEYVSAEGQPAGYYPGRSQFTAIAPELNAWLAKNQAGIDDVQTRIVQIREGKRAPGCIGEDKYTCVATLAQKWAVADDYALKDLNLFADIRYDVNGKPVNGSRITLDGYIPSYKDFSHRHAMLNLTVGASGVSKLEVELPKNPEFARTEPEYAVTGLYETVSAVTAKTCPTLGSVDVARWFENTVKPSSKLAPKERRKHRDDTRVHSLRVLDSASIAFCGRTFRFQTATGTVRHGFHHDPFAGTRVVIE